MQIRHVVLIALAAGCTERPVESSTKAVTESMSLHDCVGMFAASLHAACEVGSTTDPDACATVVSLSMHAAAGTTALDGCLGTRGDLTSCGVALDVTCPPAVSEAECAHARELGMTRCVVAVLAP